MNFKNFRFSETEKKPLPRKTLPEGDYEFKILNIEESQMTGAKIGTVPVARLTLDIEGVRAKRIDIVLSEYKMYKHILAEFLRSVNALDDNGECVLDSFEDLVGSVGKAHVVPKKLSGGATVYNVTKWLRNEKPEYYVNQKDEKTKTKEEAKTAEEIPELEPVSEVEIMAALAADMGEDFEDPFALDE